MNNQPLITRYNYEEMMPNAEIQFASLISTTYCPYREGHIGKGHFGINRYLYFDDIISLMERKIKTQSSGIKYGGSNGNLKSKKLIKKWNSMLERAMKNKNIQANKQKEN